MALQFSGGMRTQIAGVSRRPPLSTAAAGGTYSSPHARPTMIRCSISHMQHGSRTSITAATPARASEIKLCAATVAGFRGQHCGAVRVSASGQRFFSAVAVAGKQVRRLRGGGGGGGAPMQRLAAPRRAPVRRTGRSRVAVSVSANLFTRIFRIVTSFFNGLVESFEDPEKLLDRVAEEMQEDMIRMRQATAQVMASQRQLVAKQKSLQTGADQWLARAELAVSRGQDDLAREALKRRKVLQEDADRLGEQVALQTNALEQLQANIRVLEGKMGEARSKKETLKARAASAKTSLALQEMIGGLQVRSGTSWAAFEKMEEKVAQLEAQAQTASALVAPDSLERQFAALEGDTGVDAALAALKRGQQQQQQQQQHGSPKPLPPTVEPPMTGRPLRDVFDPLERELEDLRRRARE